MRVLAITKIFPNSLEPLSSPFNRQQFKALATRCELTVLEAIPYVPGARLTGIPPRAAKLATLPARETVDGIETVYMKQLYVPKLGVPVAVPLFLGSLLPFRRLARGFDVVLATWAYPDACASILFARTLGKPCVFKVHGSDLNVLARRPSARLGMRKILPLADGAVAVSRALGDTLEELGVPREKIALVANGVDTALFYPRDKRGARRARGLPEGAPVLMFCGRLEPQKGLGELLEAFDTVRAKRPDARLVLIGDGVMKKAVQERAATSGGAIVVPGARPLTEVAEWMAACDVFTLPSWAEGTPNVVLEALASGRPAVGSRVGGIPDVLSDPRSGIVVPPKNAAALAQGLLRALERTWDPAEVSACGPSSWDESGAKLYGVLEKAMKRP